jgi:predicted TIM-barrel fold metal-dependent hydrolase
VDPVDRALLPWWEALRETLGGSEMVDAHTHIGANDPDGYSQTFDELLEGLDPIDARAVVFPMHEPDGYREANDTVIEATRATPDRVVPYCRVNPRLGAPAVAEATRCLDAGARGIKLHPRAEDFTLGEPAVEELCALAAERHVPMLIHAGRGIPALGEDSVRLTAAYPDAKLILAHAAVSDLAWLWHEAPDHPNLFFDTAWWSPGDMIALFSLVPSGQILWASDSPYGRPLTAAVLGLRFAIQAGVGPQALKSIAGRQMIRILRGEEPEVIGRPPGELEPPSPALERIVSHLLAAMGAAIAGGDYAEPVSLARLSCDVRGDRHERLIGKILELLDLSAELAREEHGEERFTPSVRLLMAAMTIARTPAAPLPD